MNLLSDSTWVLACAMAFALSALLTFASIRYARHGNLIDEPGRRRSHVVPTPRGGGIAIVIAIILCALMPWMLNGGGGTLLQFALITAALVIVAAIGWIDDHRGLGRWVRFYVQWAAGFLVLAGSEDWQAWMEFDGYWLQATITMLVLIVAVVWSINLHNFMDGINGLLAWQTVFVLAAIAFLMYSPPWPGYEERTLVICVFAVLGFLPFNFPKARIFMGDVGSGSLGLIIGIAVLWQIEQPAMAIATGIILCSAFVTDATATLVSRIMSGRRWYSPHREHLYQWLVRSGISHAKVVGIYMTWNVLIVLPAVWWINRTASENVRVDGNTIIYFRDTASSILDSLPGVVVIYGLALVAWMLGKRYCLERVRLRTRGSGAQ